MKKIRRRKIRRRKIRKKVMERLEKIRRRKIRKKIMERLEKRKREEEKVEKREISISEKLLKAVQAYKRMFLDEQAGTVADLGEIPAPAVEDERVDLLGDVERETVGRDIDRLIDGLREMVPEDVIISRVVDDETGEAIAVESDEATVVIRFKVDNGEPQMVITSSDMESKVTVSLAPLIGSVSNEGEMIDRMLDDEIKGDVVDFIVELSTEGVSETEVSLEAPEFEDIVEEEPEEKGVEGVEREEEEDMEIEEEPGEEEEEDIELEDELEEEEEEEMAEGLRRKVFGDMKEQSDEDDAVKKVMQRFSYPVDREEVPTPPEVKVEGELTKKVMKQLDIGKKVSPGEGSWPDLLGYVRGEESEEKQKISQ